MQGIYTFLDNLDQYHGAPSGIFNAGKCICMVAMVTQIDELLAGPMPSQGSETCQVVEYMFSLETSFGK